MTTATTRRTETSIAPAAKGTATLHVGLELSAREWKLAMSVGLGQAPRVRSVGAGNLERLGRELGLAKERFGLPASAAVVSCYEAGRDGFWIHRALTQLGVVNYVVDSASIEVNRRARRAKSDRLDAQRLLGLLLRYTQLAETTVWRVVRVPPEAVEDARHLHRELAERKREQTRLSNQIRALLVLQGVRYVALGRLRAAAVAQLVRWDGTRLPVGVAARVQRAVERWGAVRQEIRALEGDLHARLRQPSAERGGLVATAQHLARLRAIGASTAWVLSHEMFGWRAFASSREVGGLSGLAPTPYHSGTSRHEQGISKAGNRWVRRLASELGWNWVRWQPHSELSQWYQRRFAGGGSRLRRVGIIALARKLLVALWRYVRTGVVPAGACLKPALARELAR